MWEQYGEPAVTTIVIGSVAMGLFSLAYWLIEKITPFSIKHELEEDHNVAVGIVVGSFILGVAIVVAAVARG